MFNEIVHKHNIHWLFEFDNFVLLYFYCLHILLYLLGLPRTQIMFNIFIMFVYAY